MSIFGLTQFIAIFIFAVCMIVVLKKFAPQLGLLDIPNHRSAHKQVTPRGAGIAMILAILLSDALFPIPLLGHWSVYVATCMVLLIGILDDRHHIGYKIKFLIIALAVLVLYMDGFSITTLGTFFGYRVDLGLLALPFTLFAVIGFTNALNLIDGLDGLAGGVSLVILAALCQIGFIHHDAFIINLSVSMMIAITAFLLFNWNPAKIFMGDSGSLTIGFLISVLAINALPYIQPTSIFFIALLPIMDTLIVMIRRIRNGHSPFSADKLHIHHLILTFFKGNVKKTVILLVLMQMFYSSMGLYLSDYTHQGYIVLLFILNTTIFYIFLNGMISNKK